MFLQRTYIATVKTVPYMLAIVSICCLYCYKGFFMHFFTLIYLCIATVLREFCSLFAILSSIFIFLNPIKAVFFYRFRVLSSNSILILVSCDKKKLKKNNVFCLFSFQPQNIFTIKSSCAKI